MFETFYGSGIIQDLFLLLEGKRVLFVTQQNLLDLYQKTIPSTYRFILIDDVEEETLLSLNATAPEADAVIGFGGGMSIDAAKYFAWQRALPCYLAPTAVSVDACYSFPIAVRRNRVVHYVGEVLADGIYVDYNIIKTAPHTLNLSGVGDVLSCYTALFDWCLTAEHVEGETVDSSLYDTAETLLREMFDAAKDIALVTDKGIRLIMDVYRWVGIEGYQKKHCRFEEGSEHFLAYTIESVCGKHLLHGQLVCMCVWIMSKFQQEGRQNKVKQFLSDIGLSVKPSDVGLSDEELIAALNKANAFALDNRLAFSVLNIKTISDDFIQEVMAEISI